MPVHPVRSVACRFVDSEREAKFTWAGSRQQSSNFNKQNTSHRMGCYHEGSETPRRAYDSGTTIRRVFTCLLMEPASCQVLFLALEIQACRDLQDLAVIQQVILLINVITRELHGALMRHERELSLTWGFKEVTFEMSICYYHSHFCCYCYWYYYFHCYDGFVCCSYYHHHYFLFLSSCPSLGIFRMQGVYVGFFQVDWVAWWLGTRQRMHCIVPVLQIRKWRNGNVR